MTTAYAYRTVSGNRSSAQVEFRNVRNSAGTQLEGKKYTYDALGNITMISQSTGSNYPLVAYEYDAQNQLVKETYYNGNGAGSDNVTATYTYTYDTAGNILSETKTVNGSTSTKTYTYGNSQWNDLLTSVNGQSISYDAAGNPTSYSRGNSAPYNMSWVNGRQLSYMFCYEEQWQVAYTYDAEGNRTTKNDDGIRHTYVTQNGKVVRETIGTGSTAKVLDFIYDESGKPFALKYSTNGGSSFTTYYYVVNLQGDVVKLVNAGGTAYATYTYNAWGEVLTATGSMASINPLRYRGYYYDSETGFYYLQSRYYDPVTHRFINADSFASTGQGFIGTNMYAYCNNNPAISFDYIGYERDTIWSLESDWAGISILMHWLFGDGEDYIVNGGKWGLYMNSNKMLEGKIAQIATEEAQGLKTGEIAHVDITTSMEIQNGEDMVGYQYLHGTNSNVGGFHIVGTIRKNASGKVCYNFTCTWNDIIDPNFMYQSDQMKAEFAKSLPFANPTDYYISITWKTQSYYCGGIMAGNKLTRMLDYFY